MSQKGGLEVKGHGYKGGVSMYLNAQKGGMKGAKGGKGGNQY